MSPHFSFILSRGTFFYPLSLSIFPFFFSKFRRKEGKKEEGEEGVSFSFISQISFKKEGKREKMNRMNAEEVIFISFFEEGKEEGQDQKNTKKTSFRLSTKQGLFIFYSILTSFLSQGKG